MGTSRSVFRCGRVVLAGGFANVPVVPDWASPQEHSGRYRNAHAYGDRDVLVVGSGWRPGLETVLAPGLSDRSGRSGGRCSIGGETFNPRP